MGVALFRKSHTSTVGGWWLFLGKATPAALWLAQLSFKIDTCRFCSDPDLERFFSVLNDWSWKVKLSWIDLELATIRLAGAHGDPGDEPLEAGRRVAEPRHRSIGTFAAYRENQLARPPCGSNTG